MQFWQVDAFTDQVFCGNPAAVFLFEKPPLEEVMQKIANEMNLSETVFVIREREYFEKDLWTIRWFTPSVEVDLCGHATLAAAHILWQEGVARGEQISFQSKSGLLSVTRSKDSYTLNFPLQPPVSKVNDPLYQARAMDLLGLLPEYIGTNGGDCIFVLKDAASVSSFIPDPQKIAAFEERGLLLTAQSLSSPYDYIYRAFFPKLDVLEDPVTGSANTSLAPYWAEKLKKEKLFARQVSSRGGDLTLEVAKERVLITGKAITVFRAEMGSKAICQVIKREGANRCSG
ncbi:MAG: phenazine biosynthesis protein PhzF family [Chlamydiales bacterium]|jgi:PhzF family phenazine biosynthesis protein|nr:phenazine biosynthesis protein PhzF family [Chlamydiales bacterium]